MRLKEKRKEWEWASERTKEREREGERESGTRTNLKQIKTSVQPCMVTLCLCLLTAGNCVVGNYANNHQTGGHSPQESADNHQGTQQDHISDGESQLHTLMPMQPFSPLQIPQFPGMGFSPSLSLSSLASTQTGNANQSKTRGASDCPGVCPLCGATLRQARNLRRHLLSSCKYRFTNNSTTASATMQNSVNDTAMIEIKPEVELPGYNDQSSMAYGTDSGSNSCEQIVCKPSLPSPTSHGQDVISPTSSIPSPTIAR
jgi:hypothetical protein